METITIQTQKDKQVIDITDEVQQLLTIESGICVVTSLHTTTAISLGDLDPGTDLDMLDAFREMIPVLEYRHAHDPKHTPDHILSTLIGTSLTIPVSKKKLFLGDWQKVLLFEFSGPRERTLVVTQISE